MKLKHYFLFIVIAWFPYLMGAWNSSKPAATTSLNASNPEILANWEALESVIGQDHEFSTGGTNSGKHTQVTFDDPLATDPASVAASEGVLYIKDDGGKARLFFIDEDENVVQLTSSTGIAGGSILASTIDSDAYVDGSIDHVHLASDTVDSDNIIAGAVDSTHLEGTLPDGADLAAATLAADGDRVIVDKAWARYVGNRETDSASPVTTDTDSQSLAAAHAYLASDTSGHVTAYATAATTAALKGYVGTTTDPAGAGTQLCHSEGPTGTVPYISFFVGNGKYWEVTCAQACTISWTPLLATGTSPVDQD